MMLEIALKHAFAGFTLDLEIRAPGGITALFGPSGAGKSTVVNAVAGLLRPDQGRIAVDGTVLFDAAARTALPPHRRRIGYVFQDARLFPHLNVRANLTYGTRFAPHGPGAISFDDAVAMLGLGALLERSPAALSGGEAARVALGRALLSKPRLLLLDEPLAALDAARKAEILPYFEMLRDAVKLPILYVSHAPAEIARLANSVALIEAGRLRAFGPADDVLTDPAVAGHFGGDAAGALISGHLSAQESDGLARIDTAGGPLYVQAPDVAVGQSLRLRLTASDVTLALAPPQQVSALNILRVSIARIGPAQGPGRFVQLAMGEDRFLARVTSRSATALDLRPGLNCYAMIKTVSVARDALGL
ncbi:molybdenum ABC transporter ATP-binding protein [Thioclava dalianensis]|uniref:Molybdenum ABC transporter ATP-binding protein n=1 Tax=Thioclava dalianensis TaxID=1185766 RepID=A0A074TE16_9RHOB|nr:molybdenum ABC transporter ATP-binding protein [Thioclava dalianensis]KEP69934.1 molybdenum ABC transporter ATP-binding protein [Thioclava dalianensis]